MVYYNSNNPNMGVNWGPNLTSNSNWNDGYSTFVDTGNYSNFNNYVPRPLHKDEKVTLDVKQLIDQIEEKIVYYLGLANELNIRASKEEKFNSTLHSEAKRMFQNANELKGKLNVLIELIGHCEDVIDSVKVSQELSDNSDKKEEEPLSYKINTNYGMPHISTKINATTPYIKTDKIKLDINDFSDSIVKTINNTNIDSTLKGSL